MRMITNKRAQFFILSAVIIAAIIVSMASVRNYVITGDVQKNFHYQAQQLELEAGEVVNYGLYNNDSELEDFVREGVSYLKRSYLDFEIFSCFTKFDEPTSLVCQNSGKSSLTVSNQLIESGYNTEIDISDLEEIDLSFGDKKFEISLLNHSVVKEQFYFIIYANSSHGEIVDSSAEIRRVFS